MLKFQALVITEAESISINMEEDKTRDKDESKETECFLMPGLTSQ